MNWKEFSQSKFEILCLFLLLMILMLAHTVMMHFGRPPEMIHWVEDLIGAVFTGMLTLLVNKK